MRLDFDFCKMINGYKYIKKMIGGEIYSCMQMQAAIGYNSELVL